MSKIEVDEIDKQSGSTLTLGGSGTAVTLASGATQSGFGRTGTVDWQTTKKTASFTAANGEGYFVDTTSSAITVTLPASPSAGDIVSVKDYAYTFATNNCTIARNGSPIGGGSDLDLALDTNGTARTFIYVDATKGWLVINESTDTSDTTATYITATGGTVTTCGDFKIHTFTAPGTLCVSCAGNPAGNDQFEYLVVAGGGGGGGQDGNTRAGAGAGGLRFASPSLAPATYPGKPLAGSTLTAAAQAYPITVGGGGSAGGLSGGTNGSNSIFSTITSAGGGKNTGTGGSGGGAQGGQINNPGQAGNTPPVSPPQGNPGGKSAQTSPDHASGGGGGAIEPGFDGRRPACTGRSGPGGAGAGFPTAFGSNGQPCGSFRYYAGGGGGGGSPPVSLNAGVGGVGGGASGSSSTGSSGTANTGGGAGSGGPSNDGGAGGSGIVVIRYKFQN